MLLNDLKKKRMNMSAFYLYFILYIKGENVPSVGAEETDGADEKVGGCVGYFVFLLMEDMEEEGLVDFIMDFEDFIMDFEDFIMDIEDIPFPLPLDLYPNKQRDGDKSKVSSILVCAIAGIRLRRAYLPMVLAKQKEPKK